MEVPTWIVADPTCAVCGRRYAPMREDYGACSECIGDLDAQLVCRIVHTGEDTAPIVAIWTYYGTVVRLIEAVKLRRHRRLLAYVAHHAYPAAIAAVAQHTGGVSDVTPLLPIPASARGRRLRGFDQMALTVRHVGYPIEHVFNRSAGGQQKHLDRAERHREAGRALHLTRAPSKPGIVCDDVLTSGATLERAFSLCADAGVGAIAGIVFAEKR